MMTDAVLRTRRLVLRRWRESDYPAFAELNADPRVVEFLPKALDRAESDLMARRLEENIEKLGFGLWAVEVPGMADFIGFVGLGVPKFQTHFTPCVEIGWRLAHAHWGKGYATEAAEASLAFGFEKANLAEIVSFTVPMNVRSRGVMERIGMTRREEEDFDHPGIADGDRLKRHVLYRLARGDWERRKTTR